jgi:hypothetical protein
MLMSQAHHLCCAALLDDTFQFHSSVVCVPICSAQLRVRHGTVHSTQSALWAQLAATTMHLARQSAVAKPQSHTHNLKPWFENQHSLINTC